MEGVRREESGGGGADEMVRLMDAGVMLAAFHASQICIIKKGRTYGVPSRARDKAHNNRRFQCIPCGRMQALLLSGSSFEFYHDSGWTAAILREIDNSCY